jgi:hypothetical protein
VTVYNLRKREAEEDQEQLRHHLREALVILVRQEDSDGVGEVLQLLAWAQSLRLGTNSLRGFSQPSANTSPGE